MKKRNIRQWDRWLLPGVLILFLLQAVLLPWTVGFAWAHRNDAPCQELTYTQNRLLWDSAVGLRPDGTAVLELFRTGYDGTVRSALGDKVAAPGTGNAMSVRLNNRVSGEIQYTAVLYEIRTDDRLPVAAALSGEGFADTADYSLPRGVRREQVVRAVTGTLAGGGAQDFALDWQWFFEAGRDELDTLLGNRDPLPEVTVGLYIVVEDGNGEVTPDVPQTGDRNQLGWYLGLMAISGILLVLLLWERRREEAEA